MRQRSHRKLEQVPLAIIPMLPPRQQLHIYKGWYHKLEEVMSFDKLRMTINKLLMTAGMKCSSCWRRPVSRIRKTTVIFILLFVQGCGLFQDISRRKSKDVAFLKANSVLTQVGAAFSDKISNEWIIQNDSANTRYTVQFWPKGRFTFSPEAGFEGEAERVLVIENVQSIGRAVVQRKAWENVQEQFKGALKQEQGVKISNEVESVDRSLSWKWGIAGLLLLSLLLIYVYRKFFKN